ncbi:Beta-lactamase superfamily domain-containing protein [Flagellimonas taeanensis]|jgi:L-ascorbate metabolism protein UlaG (beta-lactamase superfamily)|uniref:Beta-lactamase superfamily domain-containing protein n=1 Tax=Flagellimonas taeanensis TaxID=1005926 RepID=A0A1M6Z8L1_9FLAO|nr:MBL fold metallo-hydrolase [Allomuricauda taeanensis]SFC10895.1 Beta-lactamase superfamily domain-containing protein [Allomuricauda taeanensis]SHL26802.1 L-ascorbate metabolism protein UlaG, beta-lactamase superfamily [Allomuricauda taeanensis]
MQTDTSIWASWLGQAGFILEFQGTRLLIDPFLSDIVEIRQGLKRLMPPPLEIHELRPDHIFITHDHLDHLDPKALPEIHAHYPEAMIIGPSSVVLKAKELGMDASKLFEVFPGERHRFGAMELKIVPAYHSDPFSVGCILGLGNKQLYISGDTLSPMRFCEEIQGLADGAVHGVIICINGKLGNMDWTAAAALVECLQPTLALPMHYGMFKENTVDPRPFIETCRDMGVGSFELLPGKRTKLIL